MVSIDGEELTIEEVVAVARAEEPVGPLTEAVRRRVEHSRRWIDQALYEAGQVVYGVNTGFGPLAQTRIAPQQARALSRNIVLACIAGVGPAVPRDVVRAMMLIRANTLAAGHSGARPVLVDTLIGMLNAGVTPTVPEKGSLGASGDLAPLAHMAVVLSTGGHADDYSGQAWLGGELLSGAEAMARAGLERLVLEAKEGLALTNGTAFMAAVAALAVADAESLIRHAEVAAAMSWEGLLGLSDPLLPALHQANNQPGQLATAANLRALLAGSRLVDSSSGRIQDAYSLRCTPQVLGPIRDALVFIRQRVAGALNAASDNPLIFVEPDSDRGQAISGGNFHGQGLAMWLDLLGIAMAGAGSISERRVFRLLTPELSAGLPAMLVRTPGLDSGLMMAQYTAAALVSDNKTLAHPDSVDSIPSSANQEDHVSMGANAARHGLEILGNVRHILAIELLVAAQAIDLRPEGPARLGQGTGAAHGAIRKIVPPLEHDRALTPDINALADLIQTGLLLRTIDSANCALLE